MNNIIGLSCNEAIDRSLEYGLDICHTLQSELDEALRKQNSTLDFKLGNVSYTAYELGCCVSLELPNFYCCGEQCMFEISFEVECNEDGDTAEEIVCSANLTGLSSFNYYYTHTYDSINQSVKNSILSKFKDIILNWTMYPEKQSYLVEFINPILKENNSVVQKVYSLIAGDVQLSDIESSNKYMPESIIACDSVSIVDGTINQVTVVFSQPIIVSDNNADCEDNTDSDNNNVIVLQFKGLSNCDRSYIEYIEKSFNDCADDEFDTVPNDIIALDTDNGETINDLPDEIYKKLKFCTEYLGLDIKYYVGYSRYTEDDVNSLMLNSLIESLDERQEYSSTIIVHLE